MPNPTPGNDILTGTEGDDTLSGLGGNDTLYGLVGNDELDGGSGNDRLEGGSGDDTLTGGTGDDTLLGGSGVDTLDGGDDADNLQFEETSGGGTAHGGAGDDHLQNLAALDIAVELFGDDGNDLIEARLTNDIHGGAGDDRIVFGISAAPLLGQTVLRVDGGSGFDELTIKNRGISNGVSYDFAGVVNVEKITLTNNSGKQNAFPVVLSDTTTVSGATLEIFAQDAFSNSTMGYLIDGSAETDGHLIITGVDAASMPDTLRGGALADMLTGRAGDDTLRGNGGNDTIDGGDGVDTAVFSGNRDQYTITEGTGFVTVSGPGGTDTLRSVNRLQFADQTVTIAIPGVTLIGTNGIDNLSGGVGADFIDGKAGNDKLFGFASADEILGGVGEDVIDGGAGNDVLAGGDGIDEIHAGSGNDNVDAGAGNDLIVGGDGAGNDRYYGGSGYDTVRYTSATQAVTVNLIGGSASGVQIGQDTLISIENVIGGMGADKITGSAVANVLRGSGGKDALDGAAGADTADYSDKVRAVAVALATSTNVLVRLAGVAEDTIRNIENIVGGRGNDTLIGDGSVNALNGGVGNDVLNGGAGNDVLTGGTGNDTFVVDSAGDQVFESAGQGTDTVNASVSYRLQLGADVNLLRTGNAAATTAINFTGNAFGQTLEGNGGINMLDGGAGVDTMRGFGGNDTYRVDHVLDKVIEATGQGTDTVITSVTYTLQTGSDINLLRTANPTATTPLKLTGNAAAQTIQGNAGANAIDGGGGLDTLTGNAGNDLLNGGAGNDILIGGAGNDTFLFNTMPHGTANLDRILDFNLSADTIKMENVVFNALTNAGVLAPGAFHIGTAAHDADDRVVYNSATGALIYDANGNVAGGAVQFATLAKNLALTNADFVVI